MRVARLSLLLPAMAVLATPAEGAMHLGVNTHFDQGWPIVALDEAESARAQSIRDTISWGKVEQAPGVYDFTAANSGYVARACAAHMPVLLILTPRNKRYDNGETVFSPLGRRAFAAFAVEIAKRFPCVTGFEIGNEINGHALKGRMVQQMPGSYVAIVREVRAALTGQHAKVKLLSGSSLSVATGFFDRLFGAGLLPLVDGVVIHPYVAVPEQLPGQIARLRSAMARHGGVKPIWASEFGFYYETPEDAPPHALKMITLLSAAGIEEAHWYALRDEKWFPNMGLFANGRGKPALDSFRLAAQLLASGEARRIDAGDPLTFIYRYGNGPYVMWGGGRGIGWNGAATARDARGRAVRLPSRLDADPIIVDAPEGFSLRPSPVLADTLTDFIGTGWSYHVSRPKGVKQPLGWIDWNWTPYLGSPALPNFRVMGAVVTTARPPAGPAPELVERFKAPAAGMAYLSACFEGKADKPHQVRILSGGKQIFAGRIAGAVSTRPLAVNGSVEIGYSALLPGGPQPLRRRIRILTQPDASPALCAPRGRDTDADGN